MFGHTIKLNFDKQGDTHKTLIGGLFSMFLRLVILVYIIILWKRLLLNEADQIDTEFNMLDLETLGVVHYNQTNMTLFYALFKSTSDIPYPRIDDEMLRHIDLTYL